MASEILSIPESKLREVIAVIRSGLEANPQSVEVVEMLTKWCDEESAYMDACERGE